MEYTHVLFRERKDVSIHKKLDGEGFRQNGRGAILWVSSWNKDGQCFIGNEPKLWENGESREIRLNGCAFEIDRHGHSDCFSISGMDYEGRGWKIYLGPDVTWSEIKFLGYRNSLGVTAKEMIAILGGQPFAEMLAGCRRVVEKKEMTELRSEAEFAAEARETLEKIRQANKRGGPGSRKEVGALIDELMA
ncbi:MAG: hypothetical protein A3D65_06120 [Candidatus Lloydbacteria bacterium RIFCSPHIGHO2_02_FULL_50_13]|uniref:Uncharacterized protein n=1 Tax=Candidatus Lloydbacteria bacterium RIFCSPHIGHO2_02_FULL_50_13 TaxID=1798661 RepID=A0A1G2D580_9BACT|nr:MAG: hypothetical protein A3D65_06120 [Candidatus Lloydbacteria bacterium RIFCSPHIGHO2_02_FULL_50_13]